MNNLKRKELSKIENRLIAIKDTMYDVKRDLEYLCDDEDDILNNMENFSGTDRYAAIEDAVDHMSDAIDSLDEAIDNMDDALEQIIEARN